MKIYTRLALTEAEFQSVRSCVVSSREVVFAKLALAREFAIPAEAVYYESRVDAYDALIRKLDAVLIADTSQDAEPDEDEDTEEDTEDDDEAEAD